MRRTLKTFERRAWRDERAVAATEFAVIFPLLLLLLGGTYETFRFVEITRRITSFSGTAATMLATNNTGTVNYVDLQYANDSAMIVAPNLLSESYAKGVAWGNDIQISMAGVSFTPTVQGCTSGCTYKANVVWTGGKKERVCGTNPTSTADASSPSAMTLPVDLFDTYATPSGSSAPHFEIVVDAIYTWTPLVFGRLFGPITISRSSYVPPRYVSQITYSTVPGDNGIGAECPGF